MFDKWSLKWKTRRLDIPFYILFTRAVSLRLRSAFTLRQTWEATLHAELCWHAQGFRCSNNSRHHSTSTSKNKRTVTIPSTIIGSTERKDIDGIILHLHLCTWITSHTSLCHSTTHWASFLSSARNSCEISFALVAAAVSAGFSCRHVELLQLFLGHDPVADLQGPGEGGRRARRAPSQFFSDGKKLRCSSRFHVI